jgi:hypothetical protein
MTVLELAVSKCKAGGREVDTFDSRWEAVAGSLERGHGKAGTPGAAERRLVRSAA